jgi:hypothetical protein
MSPLLFFILLSICVTLVGAVFILILQEAADEHGVENVRKKKSL